MEDLHHIDKDVPFGYWVLWVQPVINRLARKWRERRRTSLRWELLRWG